MEYLTHIFTFLVGLGAGWTAKIVVSKIQTNNSQKRKTAQNNNTVHGDMAGGDMNKNNRQ
ncbi:MULTISPECIES: hypothetical protein [Pseudomonas]|jgi:hypothetical protein|uniref:Uncharacterized protein n=1 Tax=Pseudomonas triticicola TaxID=2842345 RepID=A0ABS6RFU7_9PSED|nr:MULTISPECIES: hypothetical protein [Pseudomonas]MBV4545093.1 hypothetical protein [Pseudomonas triticicola]